MMRIHLLSVCLYVSGYICITLFCKAVNSSSTWNQLKCSNLRINDLRGKHAKPQKISVYGSGFSLQIVHFGLLTVSLTGIVRGLKPS